MSIFGDIDVASANDNPFFKPDGKYICMVTKAEVRESRNGNLGMSLEYTIQEGEKAGKKISEWKFVPTPWELKGYESKEDLDAEVNFSAKTKEDAERNLSFIKQRLKQFGFSTEEMNDVSPEQLLSLPWLTVEIKNYNGRENINSIEITADATGSGSPFS